MLRTTEEIENDLASAIENSDSKGYTGMLNSQGSFLDDPDVQALIREFQSRID